MPKRRFSNEEGYTDLFRQISREICQIYGGNNSLLILHRDLCAAYRACEF